MAADESASKLANAYRAAELGREIGRVEWLADRDRLGAEELRELPRVLRELQVERERELLH